MPWPGPVLASGASKVVKLPRRLRTYPCETPPESMKYPVISPQMSKLNAKVPWPEAVPAPGALKVVNVPLSSRMKPWATPLPSME